MKKVRVTFETVTPLFTGNINQEMTEIKPASIMGSLRFWFEVICHYSGQFKRDNYESQDLNHKAFKEYIKNNPNATDNEIRDKFNLSPTAFYFGCTGWKSKIGIEKIEYDNTNISVHRGYKPVVKGKNWRYPEKYYDINKAINVTFTVREAKTYNEVAIKDSILLPLLNFIQKYAFVGGKNNIGFGRVTILDPQIDNSPVFKILGTSVRIIDDCEGSRVTDPSACVNRVQDFGTNSLKINDCIIKILDSIDTEASYQEIIQTLLKKKADFRKQYNSNDRHRIFGHAARNRNEETDATKVMPFISKEPGGKYTGTLISYAGIVSMEDSMKGGE